MINVSNEFLQLMNERTDFTESAVITFADGTVLNLTSADFSISNNMITDGAGSGSFPLGAAVEKIIQIELMNDDGHLSAYDFFGASIQLFLSFELSETTETINYGTYTVVSPETYGTTVIIQAADEMHKADTEYTTNLTFPVSLGIAVMDSCSACGITLLTTTFKNDDYVIDAKPENLTHRQFIAAAAMIACGYARMDYSGRLCINSFDFAIFEQEDYLDGGVFDSGYPHYETGASADGGIFNPWDTADEFDGGTMTNLGKKYHVLTDFLSLKVETDDVVITGLRTTADDVAYETGTEGYVLELDNQLFSGKEQEAIELIGSQVIGFRFRPFEGDYIGYPIAEFGDLAYVTDLNKNTYQTIITDINFTFFGRTVLKCAAESPLRNSSKYYSDATKTIVAARKEAVKQISEYDKAVQMLTNLITQSFGVYKSEEVLADGSTVYYMHNKPTLEESRTIWKMTADAFAVSTDGGAAWNAGIDSSGNALVNVLSAIGINSEWINTRGFTARDNSGNITFVIDPATGSVTINADSVSIGGKAGATQEYVDSATDSVTGDLADFTDSVTRDIENIQAQVDGQIENYYYDYEPTIDNLPASEWQTESDLERHVGDIFYWKSKGYSYRFLKNGDVWGWTLIKDTDVTKAIASAAEAQDTADSKRRVFVTTPIPPYDVGDLWTNGTDILTCSITRSSGNYVSTDWLKQNTYTDDTKANQALSAAQNAQAAVNGLTQAQIFNILTNNGQTQGIYLSGGRLYINFEYAKGQTLTLGGSNSPNYLVVKDSRGTIIGKWNATDGFYASRGTFGGTLNGADGTFGGTLKSGKVEGGVVSGTLVQSYDADGLNGIEMEAGEQKFFWDGFEFGSMYPASDVIIDEDFGNVFETQYLYFNCAILAQEIGQTSDENLKDLLPWHDDYDEFLMNLTPICFTWNNKNDPRVHTGFGAQSTKEVLKQFEIKNSGLVTVDKSGRYGMYYQDLHALEVYSIQKNRELIHNLSTKIEELEKTIAELKSGR